MNIAVLQGRLTKDPEIRYSQGSSSTCIASFTLAVDRRFKREGEPDADFFPCTAFSKTAEIAEKYLTKGSKISVVGRLQNDKYERDGQTRTITKVVVSDIYFCESKGGGSQASTAAPAQSSNDGFMSIPDADMLDLPFA